MSQSTSLFEQNLAATLEKRKEKGRYRPLYPPHELNNTIDFGSTDVLHLSASGALRREFIRELERNPGFQVGSKGSRLIDGNNQYVVDLEAYLANFHKAETALFFNSGFEANLAVFRTLPQPGDVIVHDEFVHASAIDGMRLTRAASIHAFKHNNVKSFKEVLKNVKNSFPSVREGRRSVFIAIESLYSMDGDYAPVHQILSAAKEAFPLGNIVFYIDEAHTSGIIGLNGSGFVCHYGLEHEFAVRVHTFGKAPSSHAIVMGSPRVKDTLANYARNFIYSTGPSFPSLACVKAGYNILGSSDGEDRRQRLPKLTAYFLQCFFKHPVWEQIKGNGTISILNPGKFVSNGLVSPIVPIITKTRAYDLRTWLLREGINAWGVAYPVVPKGEDRVRIVIHSDNTRPQIERLVDVIMQWALEQDKILEVKSQL
ncbi:aminotransferase [Stipitochalara longipes BDJ]|nr:aminotransferase [Stipitochalara longipes BDJ]